MKYVVSVAVVVVALVGGFFYYELHDSILSRAELFKVLTDTLIGNLFSQRNGR